MRIIPPKATIIETNLSSEEAIKRISEHVDKPTKWYKYRLPFDQNYFEGIVHGKSFQLTSMKNDAVIEGLVYEDNEAAALKVKIKLAPISNAVMLTFFLCSLLLIVYMVVSLIKSLITEGSMGLSCAIDHLIPFGLSSLLYVIWAGNYNRSIDANIRIFKKIFNDSVKQVYFIKWGSR